MRPLADDGYGVNSTAEGSKWISIVTSFVGVMIIPVLSGIWIARLLGTKCLFLILGMILGFVGRMYCLLGIVKANVGVHQSR